MTYSVLARCERTGQLGVATSTSDVAVGARVPWLRTGVGAVVTQHRTDPRLGPRMLDLMALGASAEEAVEGARHSSVHAEWRQLAAIGTSGPGVGWTGAHVDRTGVAVVSADDHVVVGNILVGQVVGDAASAAFAADAGLELGERLVRALEAGLAAGGEPDPLRSACLRVHGAESFPLVDLRVDEHPEPLRELRRLWELYGPAAGEYVSRAIDPDAARGVAPGADLEEAVVDA
ncbi:DUF1028 domain-containing protein [Nocardioides sp. W7]|uniref:DUF1028 domain-containing protein n=1 Tax=Nocardioides sp. W7 TaxID=2931390 RepID=UPI001FD0B5FF|nr:DUF1028 domain-containing protein [Nocardioides sp. W7]